MNMKSLNKTQISLIYSLLSLLEKHSFKKITVNDICAEAMISRSSFYVYFQDKSELLQYCVISLKEYVRDRLQSSDLDTRIEQFISIVYEKSNILSNLIKDASNTELLLMLQDLLTEDFGTLDDLPLPHYPDIPPDVHSAFYAGGITSLLLLWTRDGFQIPAETMAGYMKMLLRLYR